MKTSLIPLHGDKPLGSPAVWAEKARARPYDSVKVPCGECNACCWGIKDPIPVIPGIDAVSKLKTRKGESGLELRHRKDGSCVHLVEGKCSVHDIKPVLCAAYDCRMLLYCGVTLQNNPRMMQALTENWAPAQFDEADIDAMNALRAGVYLANALSGEEHGDSLMADAVLLYDQLLPKVMELRENMNKKPGR